MADTAPVVVFAFNRPRHLRAVMQALAAELAAPVISEQTLDELKAVNMKFSQAVTSKDDFYALKMDEAFHQLIVDAADNPYISSIVSSLQPHVQRLFFHNSIIMTEESIQEHDEIIVLLRENRSEQLSSLMRGNWLRAIHEFQSSQK